MAMGKSRKEREAQAARQEERLRLKEEVREAEKQCEIARMHFEQALGHDQVDYAIFSLEAAEKKLDMTLRKARLSWDAEPPEVPKIRIEGMMLGGERA